MVYVLAIIGGTVVVGLVVAGLSSFMKSWKGEEEDA